MPGGGIPIGAPRPGGIPMGGPMGGRMPGGGPIIPTGGRSPANTHLSKAQIRRQTADNSSSTRQPPTWGWSSSAHWRRGSPSRWILRRSSGDAGARGGRCNSSSALWGHDLEPHSNASAPENRPPTARLGGTAYLLGRPAHAADRPR